MKKIIKLVLCIVLLGTIAGATGVWKDKQLLQNTLTRLPIAEKLNSDEVHQLKLQVKDAVVKHLKPIMEKIPTKEEVMDYFHNNLPALETFSNGILDALGIKDRKKVTLQPQAFDARAFDAFLTWDFSS